VKEEKNKKNSKIEDDDDKLLIKTCEIITLRLNY